MNTTNLEYLRLWVGREESSIDLLTVNQARLMAATLGLPQDAFQEGSPLPPLWHWIFFLKGLPPAELGPDGHPMRGGFLPPVPLPNRMWAGGTVEFTAPVLLGARLEKRTSIQSVQGKQGSSGELVFVKVLHEILQKGETAIREIHDIVYTQANVAARKTAPMQMPRPQHSKKIRPDSTLLFRYSALTFNGHRIHYDVDYCREVEGYPNLVIHGPLSATLLAGFAEEIAGRPIKEFHYRGVQPSFLGTDLTINAAKADDENSMSLWTELPGNAISMRAEAHFQPL